MPSQWIAKRTYQSPPQLLHLIRNFFTSLPKEQGLLARAYRPTIKPVSCSQQLSDVYETSRNLCQIKRGCFTSRNSPLCSSLRNGDQINRIPALLLHCRRCMVVYLTFMQPSFFKVLLRSHNTQQILCHKHILVITKVHYLCKPCTRLIINKL